MSEALVEARLRVGRHTEGHDVDDLGIVEVLPGGQGTNEGLRLTGAATHEDARTVSDPAHGMRGGLDLGGIAGLPRCVGIAHRRLDSSRPRRSAHRGIRP